MSAPSTVEFVLKGTIAGNPISLRDGIPFAHFQEFNADVHDFVLGSDSKAVLQDVNIQATEGSYLLRVLIPAGILGTLAGDTARLARPEALAELDPKRAAVVIRWQQRARMDSSLTYCIRSPENEFPPITINQNTGFQFTEKAQWALVEKYLMGKITDWGGEPSCNVHLRLRNSGKIIIIQAKEDSIRGRENLVYQRAVVHVKGKENVKTGELENLTLIDMWPYRPDVDEAQLEQLFEKGRKAWADVPDVGAWLEELRGGSHA